MAGRAIQFLTAGGPLSISALEVEIKGLIFTPGTTASSCSIKEGGTGGTVVLSLAGAANGPSIAFSVPFVIQAPFLSAIAGTGATLTVVM